MGRRGRARRALALVVVTVGTLIGATACDSGGSSTSDRPSATPTLSAAERQAIAADRQAAAAYGTALTTWSRRYATVLRRVTPAQLRSSRPTRLHRLYPAVPRLAAATSQQPPVEYAVAADIAARVSAIVSELQAYDVGADWIAYYEAYGHYLDNNRRLFDSLAEAGNQSIALDRPSRAAEARILRQQLQRDIRSERTLQRQGAALARKKRSNRLLVSALAYQHAEVERTIAFQRDYLAFARRSADLAERAYRDLYAHTQDYFAVAIITPDSIEPALTRSLSAALTSLAGLATQELTELPETAPLVGDTYRALIDRRVTRSQAATRKGRTTLTDQLWMLHRIRELERTPDAAYQAARQMLFLQITEDSRSAFERFLALPQLWSTVFPGDSDRSAARAVAWMQDWLAEPVPPVLEPTRQELLGIVAKVEPIVDNLGSDRYWDRMGTQVERSLRRAARALDAPSLVGQVREAVDATRPTAGPGSSGSSGTTASPTTTTRMPTPTPGTGHL